MAEKQIKKEVLEGDEASESSASESSIVNHDSKLLIKTKIDRFLEIIDSEGNMKLSEIAQKLNMNQEAAAEWAKILENSGFVELKYPLMGGIEIVRKIHKTNDEIKNG
ncbi:MAG: MarR family transcriptional regulator [Nanoarchaeota archaeon]|nr:MarR family transcriptional regulator [Nanoarchaeota archaeon]